MTKLIVDFRKFENAPKMRQEQSAPIDGRNMLQSLDQCVLCSCITKCVQAFHFHQNHCYSYSPLIEYYLILMVEKGILTTCDSKKFTLHSWIESFYRNELAEAKPSPVANAFSLIFHYLIYRVFQKELYNFESL
jgi:hypothetical protein